jgi:hypothetical protein
MNTETLIGEAGRPLPAAPWLGDRQLALQLLNSNHPLEQFEIFVKATGLKWHGLFSGYDCDIEDEDNRATMKSFGAFCALWEEVFMREGVKSPND